MLGRPSPLPDDPHVRFRELFDEHAQAVLSYGTRRCESAADAADLLADTMLVAWRRIDDVPRGVDTLPWLYGVARLQLGNQRRGHRRRSRLVARIGSHLEPHVQDTAQDNADRAWVSAALTTLNELDREVLTLTLWEGLSPAEAAIALDIPAATVRTRLHRARRRVGDELERSKAERFDAAGHDGMDERPLVCGAEETR